MRALKTTELTLTWLEGLLPPGEQRGKSAHSVEMILHDLALAHDVWPLLMEWLEQYQRCLNLSAQGRNYYAHHYAFCVPAETALAAALEGEGEKCSKCKGWTTTEAGPGGIIDCQTCHGTGKDEPHD